LGTPWNIGGAIWAFHIIYFIKNRKFLPFNGCLPAGLASLQNDWIFYLIYTVS
jgi:hypothetical protein